MKGFIILFNSAFWVSNKSIPQAFASLAQETAADRKPHPLTNLCIYITNCLLQGKPWNDGIVVEGEVLTKGLPAESSWSLVLCSKRLLVKRLSLSPPFLVLLSTWYFHTLYSSKGEQRRNLWQEGRKLHTKGRVFNYSGVTRIKFLAIPCYIPKCHHCITKEQ